MGWYGAGSTPVYILPGTQWAQWMTKAWPLYWLYTLLLTHSSGFLISHTFQRKRYISIAYLKFYNVCTTFPFHGNDPTYKFIIFNQYCN